MFSCCPSVASGDPPRGGARSESDVCCLAATSGSFWSMISVRPFVCWLNGWCSAFGSPGGSETRLGRSKADTRRDKDIWATPGAGCSVDPEGSPRFCPGSETSLGPLLEDVSLPCASAVKVLGTLDFGSPFFSLSRGSGLDAFLFLIGGQAFAFPSSLDDSSPSRPRGVFTKALRKGPSIS